MVRADQRGIEPTRWSPDVVTLLHLAASLPDVDRILINPAIKQQLCETTQGDRSWLRLMRPWYDHSAHMHIRFRCPADQHDCVQAAAATGRRWLRCYVAVVVRPVERTAAVAADTTSEAVSSAGVTRGVQGGDGGSLTVVSTGLTVDALRAMPSAWDGC